MKLVLRPNADTESDEYQVYHGDLEVENIYKRRLALTPEYQWLWALNGVPEGPCGVAIAAPATTLDEAIAGLEGRWEKWLAWAKLSGSA